MDDGVIAARDRRHGDARNAGRRGQRGKESERQMGDRLAEFGAVGAVPGVDGVEGFERRDAGAVEDAEEVEAGVDDRAGAVGEADQGKHRARGPDFGVFVARGFEGGQGEDHVADGAGTDQQAAGHGDGGTV